MDFSMITTSLTENFHSWGFYLAITLLITAFVAIFVALTIIIMSFFKKCCCEKNQLDLMHKIVHENTCNPAENIR